MPALVHSQAALFEAARFPRSPSATEVRGTHRRGTRLRVALAAIPPQWEARAPSNKAARRNTRQAREHGDTVSFVVW
jgi:hypothetical protein